jgi:hypothetical protein
MSIGDIIAKIKLLFATSTLQMSFVFLSTLLLIVGFLYAILFDRANIGVILGTFGPLASIAWGWFFNKKYQIRKKLTARFG